MSVYRRSLSKSIQKDINPVKCLTKEVSTNQCYINTGIFANNNTAIELKIKSPLKLNENKEEWCFFGSRQNGTNSSDSCWITCSSTGNGSFYAGFGNKYLSVFKKAEINKDYKIEINSKKITINGQEHLIKNETEFEGIYPLLLGALLDKGKVDNRQNTGAIYYCKIWQEENLVRDFVPCLDDKSVACMFDKVTNRYFYSEVDAFDYEIIDENYEGPVKYIESTGTQYIDTEFIPSSETKVIMEFEVLDIRTQFYFGARTNMEDTTYSFLQFSSKFRSDFGNDSSNYNESQAIKELVSYPHFVIKKDKNITTYSDNYITKRTYQEFKCKYNMYIFNVNHAGAADSRYQGSKMKLYSFKIYENDELIRDFVPWIHNKIACLYDYVTDKFYYNKGSSEFLYNLEKTRYAHKSCLLDLDGINNTRNGHNATASIWEDLSGNNNDCSLSKMEGYAEWGIDYLRNTNTKPSADVNIDTNIMINNYEKTISFIISNTKNQGNGLFSTTAKSANFNGLIVYNEFIAQRRNQYNKNIFHDFFGETKTNYDIIFTRNKIKLYKNGILIKTANNAEGLADTQNLRIFGTNINTQCSRCMSLHKVLVYNRAITEEEIKLNYRLNKSRFNIIEETAESEAE